MTNRRFDVGVLAVVCACTGDPRAGKPQPVGLSPSCSLAAPVAIAKGLEAPTKLKTDGTSIYFVAGGALHRVDKEGGAPIRIDGLAGGGDASGWGYAVDDTSIY